MGSIAEYRWQRKESVNLTEDRTTEIVQPEQREKRSGKGKSEPQGPVGRQAKV